ncbi:MAG: transcription termination factor Rho [Spirochaetae bacterium HGW-Spirochaetae-8]|nr:MAG: transcription termination factor Rho [Spirochaetae bacterium HGW-Spirochaetae-8]
MEEIGLESPDDNPNAPKITVNDLSVLSLPALRQRAAEYGISSDSTIEMKKQEVIVEILKAHTATGGVIQAYGSLEILPDGYGFLRSPQNNYLSGPEDIYISPSQIKLLSLKTGDTVEGQIRSPRDAERFFAMVRVQAINYDPPAVAKARASFDSLTPLYPDSRLNLETEDGEISTRIINLFCPIGKGQRSLIVAPPRAGKTILMQKIANAISANHPEVYLMVLLIDERPEEVTDMRRTVKGEVIASTFDEQATRHVSVAEMVIEKAKRLVEHKRDVVILLDNITRLARAYNQTVPASGKILSGGVDSNALHKPKRFLGAARNIEHGGSLTIIASALIETGSRMDEVIFEEFKGTGNNEIVLDRRMAERRMFPALNIKKSGTRREDLLLTAEETAKIWALRNAINPMEDIEMTELLIDKMKKTKNNEAFLRSMNSGFN